MKLNQPRHIVDFQELDTLLGNDFILFCGSAISAGVINKQGIFVSFLPMVGTSTEAFFLNLHEYLANDDYIKTLLSKYALQLGNGKYRLRRLTRKFEDFIWRLEQIVGADNVVKLLYSLYYCEPDQFLHNHIAIANLLNSKRARFCLTTNFDNAIEVANPNVSKLVHVQGFSIDSIPDNPTILKLHGDVVEGKYIATIPQLMAEETAEGFSYLEHILANKVVLIAGYSGNGDIDIAPHLRKAKKMGARLIWLVRPGDLPSDIATDWFATDLVSPNSVANCLVKLGGITKGSRAPKIKINPPWQSRLKHWCDTVFSSATNEQFIDMLDMISGWGNFQLYFINKWNSTKVGKNINKDVDLLNFGKRCLGVGTYYSALSAIRQINRENIRKLGLHNELLFIKGFSSWRLVQLIEASNILRQFNHFEDNGQLTEIEKSAFRVYVEVLHEIISSYVSQLDAYNFYYDHQVNTSCLRLLSMMDKDSDPGSIMLSRLMVLDIERGIGRRCEIDDYRELYQRALDLQLWGFARVTARSILRINVREGIGKLRFVHRKAGETWVWHSIKHNSLAVIDVIPKFIVNPTHIANIILSRVPVLIREVLLRVKRVIWWVAYRLSIVITE